MWDPGSHPQLDRIEAKLGHVTRMLQAIIQKENITMSVLDDLKAQVSRETTVNQSAVTLINGIPGLIQSKLDAFAAANPGVSTADLQSLVDEVKSNADGLAAAVSANTPAAAVAGAQE